MLREYRNSIVYSQPTAKVPLLTDTPTHRYYINKCAVLFTYLIYNTFSAYILLNFLYLQKFCHLNSITFSLEFYRDDLMTCCAQCKVTSFCFCHTSTRNAKCVIWYSDSLGHLSLADLPSEQKIANWKFVQSKQKFRAVRVLQSRVRDYEIPRHWEVLG